MSDSQAPSAYASAAQQRKDKANLIQAKLDEMTKAANAFEKFSAKVAALSVDDDDEANVQRDAVFMLDKAHTMAESRVNEVAEELRVAKLHITQAFNPKPKPAPTQPGGPIDVGHTLEALAGVDQSHQVAAAAGRAPYDFRRAEHETITIPSVP